MCTSTYRIVSGGFETFKSVLQNQLFLAQLLSTQKLSALTPLFKFSVANLNFKCLASHVYLVFLFDKSRYFESVWYCVFNFIF